MGDTQFRLEKNRSCCTGWKMSIQNKIFLFVLLSLMISIFQSIDSKNEQFAEFCFTLFFINGLLFILCGNDKK